MATDSQLLQLLEVKPPELNIDKIISAAFIGAVGALAYDLGVAIGSGPPLDAQQAIADIMSGTIGGAAGEIVIELTGSNLVGLSLGAFLTGLIYQIIIEENPKPPAPPEQPPAQSSRKCRNALRISLFKLWLGAQIAIDAR